MVGLAADWRYDDVQAGHLHDLHPAAQEDEIAPPSLNRHHLRMPEWRQAERRFAVQREPGSDEAGIRPIGTVVRSDFDLAGQIVFQHGLDFAIPVWPVHADEVQANAGADDKPDGKSDPNAASMLP